ncbi:MAG: aspartate kinase [Bdellovibrionia bacterium]
MNKLIVQKYGGATLADPEKIKAVSARIAKASASGDSLIIVVSAMGKTTNDLIALAQQVSKNPQRRELDMLLTVGERISMSLVSMALNDQGCAAISFTGSQAGILTNESHVSAFIQDVKAFRVEEALKEKKVVILAGFQGVSPKTKEITTLGRGGSDTTAVAMAAAFSADQCEILKDVPAVFSADPKLINDAKPIHQLHYDQLMEMTFWGAKVLHYRSVELAKLRNVKLYIGPAAHEGVRGTWVTKDREMFETTKGLSLNTHESVIQIAIKGEYAGGSLKKLHQHLDQKQIAFPQILHTDYANAETQLLVTGPKEVLTALIQELDHHNEIQLKNKNLCTVTLTCTGVTSPEISESVLGQLEKSKIQPHKMMMSPMSITVLLDQQSRDEALKALHALI